MFGRLTGHDPQTIDALGEPDARGRRRHADYRLRLNRDRATRSNPSGPGQRSAADELVSVATAAPPPNPDPTCIAAPGARPGNAAWGSQSPRRGTPEGAPPGGSAPGFTPDADAGTAGPHCGASAGGTCRATPDRRAGPRAAATANVERGRRQSAVAGTSSDPDAGSDASDANRGCIRGVLMRRVGSPYLARCAR